MKKSTKKGFTLVELVIVIAVIAILSAILIPTFGNVISNANETKYQSGAKAGYEEVLANQITAHPEISDYDMIIVYSDTKLGSSVDFSKTTRAYLANGGNLTAVPAAINAEGATINVTTKSNKNVEKIEITPAGGSATATTLSAITEFSDAELVPNTELYKVNDNVAVLFYKA